MKMLEKIARAIHADWIENYDHGGFEPVRTPYDELPEKQKEFGRSQARIASRAARDMTDQEVYNEYLEACSLGGDIIGGPETFRTEVWPAMIDAILKEGGE